MTLDDDRDAGREFRHGGADMSATTRSAEGRDARQSAGTGPRLCLAGFGLLAMLGAGAPACLARPPPRARRRAPLLRRRQPPPERRVPGHRMRGCRAREGQARPRRPAAALPVEPAKTGTSSVTLLPPTPETVPAAVAVAPAPTPRQQAERARRPPSAPCARRREPGPATCAERVPGRAMSHGAGPCR